MISTHKLNLKDFLHSVYIPDRINLSASSADQLRIAVNLLDRWAGKRVTFEDLKFDSAEKLRSPNFRDRRLLVRWMQWLKSSPSPNTGRPRSPRTVNNKVDSILTIWRYAFDQGFCDHFPRKIQKLKLPKRVPRSWSPKQIGIMLRQCNKVLARMGWSGRHWKALILTLYDTDIRIGTALKLERDEHYLEAQSQLYCPAEIMKGDADKLFDLHAETCRTIEALPESKMLFDFPWSRKDIQRHFREQILIPAGLPHSRRDMFHKIRRTSYTYVYKSLGLQAASEHAAHTSDLSKYYLDPTKLDRTSPIDVLPRPEWGEKPERELIAQH